jgi:hypothetical protein
VELVAGCTVERVVEYTVERVVRCTAEPVVNCIGELAVGCTVEMVAGCTVELVVHCIGEMVAACTVEMVVGCTVKMAAECTAELIGRAAENSVSPPDSSDHVCCLFLRDSSAVRYAKAGVAASAWAVAAQVVVQRDDGVAFGRRKTTIEGLAPTAHRAHSSCGCCGCSIASGLDSCSPHSDGTRDRDRDRRTAACISWSCRCIWPSAMASIDSVSVR